MRKAKGAEYYNRMTHEKWHYRNMPLYPIWDAISFDIMATPGANVLDIGCGEGFMAHMLADRGLDLYTGVDFSETRIAIAKRRTQRPSWFHVMDVTTDEWHSTCYNIVVATEFLEHVDNDVQIVKEVRPGTRVFISVPNFICTAHVRCFPKLSDVIDRYGKIVDCSLAKTFCVRKDVSIHLISGVRCE